MKTMASHRPFYPRPLGLRPNQLKLGECQLELHDRANPLPRCRRPRFKAVINLNDETITLLNERTREEQVFTLEELALRQYPDGHWGDLYLRVPFEH